MRSSSRGRWPGTIVKKSESVARWRQASSALEPFRRVRNQDSSLGVYRRYRDATHSAYSLRRATARRRSARAAAVTPAAHGTRRGGSPDVRVDHHVITHRESHRARDQAAARPHHRAGRPRHRETTRAGPRRVRRLQRRPGASPRHRERRAGGVPRRRRDAVRQEVRRREQDILAAHEATRVLARFRSEPLRASARVPDDRLPVLGRVTRGRAHALRLDLSGHLGRRNRQALGRRPGGRPGPRAPADRPAVEPRSSGVHRPPPGRPTPSLLRVTAVTSRRNSAGYGSSTMLIPPARPQSHGRGVTSSGGSPRGQMVALQLRVPPVRGRPCRLRPT